MENRLYKKLKIYLYAYTGGELDMAKELAKQGINVITEREKMKARPDIIINNTEIFPVDRSSLAKLIGLSNHEGIFFVSTGSRAICEDFIKRKQYYDCVFSSPSVHSETLLLMYEDWISKKKI